MRLSFMSLLLFVLVWVASGQNTLTIKINNLRNNNGIVWLELLNEKGLNLKGVSARVIDNSCTITIENLSQSKYAFKYFHDENNNKKLDTNWLGIPTEGFGYSNNAKSMFGPPGFEKTIFELQQNTTLECLVMYLKIKPK